MRRIQKALVPLYWYAGVSIIASIFYFVTELLFARILPANFPGMNSVSKIIGIAVGTAICFGSLLFPWHRNRGVSTSEGMPRARNIQRWGPILLGIVFICHMIAELINLYNILHRLPAFPSWADVAYLSQYAFLLFILFFLPNRALSKHTYSRVLLDSLMIMTAVTTFSWYFLLGPTILQEDATLFVRLLNSTYPFIDLVMFLGFLFLSARSSVSGLRPLQFMLLLSLTLMIVGDSLGYYKTLQHGHPLGIEETVDEIMQAAQSVAYGLFGVTAYFMRYIGASSEFSTPSEKEMAEVPSMWLSFLPYALIPAIGLLVFSTLHTGKQGALEVGVYLGGAVLLVEIFLRQISAMRESMSYAKQLDRANTLLESLATTDPLTELPNHRALLSMLDQELERSLRYERSCSLLFLDIDHFKALNDGYGHASGDTVLREFSSTVRALIRAVDNIGRWGGEEFVVILPETQVEAALNAAERIRTAIGRHAFGIGGGMHLTCSIGVASFPVHAHNRETLVAAADQGMYGAKRLGRNQVRAAGDPAVLTILAENDRGGGRDEAALLGTVEALASLVEMRDFSTGHRSQQTATFILELARSLNLPSPEAQMFALAGHLHDIGKIAIPDAILAKAGQLTEKEWVLVRTHPEVSAAVISHIPSLRPIAPVIRAHHERWDGSGYPDGLAGENIPLGARIIAVVDAYTAMICDRPYQKARLPYQALEELQRCAGTQFDPRIVEVVVRLLEAKKDQEQLLEVTRTVLI
jgi:two-component system cell cycle response regulator